MKKSKKKSLFFSSLVPQKNKKDELPWNWNSSIPVPEPAEIKQIDFGWITPEDTLSHSVCGISKVSQLQETRLGPFKHHVCSTCGEEDKCPSHLGHISLVIPITHPFHVTTILKIARSICFGCSELLIPESDPRFLLLKNAQGEDKLKIAAKLGKAVTFCCLCGTKQPHFPTPQNPFAFDMRDKETKKEWKDTPTPSVTAFYLWRLFQCISNTNCLHLGLKVRPETFFVTHLCLSNIWRQTESQEGILNRQIKEIVYLNTKISSKVDEIRQENPIHMNIKKEEEEESEQNDVLNNWCLSVPSQTEQMKEKECFQKMLLEFVGRNVEDVLLVEDLDLVALNHPLISFELSLLQFEVTALFKNQFRKGSLPVSFQAKAECRTSIPDLLKGKDKLIRGNLQGQRVGFSSRAVISQSPDSDLDVVVIPLRTAQKETLKIVVTPRNIHELMSYIRSSTYPRAVAIHLPDQNQTIDLCASSQSNLFQTLEVGWEVERQLVTGDYVLLNRQPSLHGLSLRTCRIEVNRDPNVHVVRISQGLLPGFAGDCDGDEFTFHWLQTPEARVEAKELLHVSRHLCTPQSGRPLAGPVQDTILGLFKLTSPASFFDKKQAFQLLSQCRYLSTYQLPEPSMFVLDATTHQMKGLWTGKQIFSMTLPIIHYERKEEGGVALLVRQGQLIRGQLTAKDISNVNNNLLHLIIRFYGAALAVNLISDWQRLGVFYLSMCGVTCGLADCISTEQIRSEKERLIQCIDASLSQRDENNICKALSQAQHQIGLLVRSKESRRMARRFDQIIRSGAKAKEINRVQMEFPGMTSLHGSRMLPHFFNATSCFFAPGDRRAASRGLITSSFEEGLSLSEMFFQAKDARQSGTLAQQLVPEQGYFMRTCRMATENCHVDEQRLMVDHHQNIYEFSYGHDFVSGQHVVFEDLPLASMTDQEIFHQCGWVLGPVSELQHLCTLRDKLRLSPKDLPFSVWGLVSLYSHKKKKSGMSPLTIKEHQEWMGQFFNKLTSQVDLSSFLSHRPVALEASICFWMCSKKMVFESQITSFHFMQLLDHILRIYRLSLITPGSSLGVIATTSICEPLTQTSLGAQHKTNAHSIEIEQSLSLQEITRLSRKGHQQPNMFVFIKPEYHHCLEDCQRWLECLTLRQLTNNRSCHIVSSVDFSKILAEDGQQTHDESLILSDFLHLLHPKKILQLFPMYICFVVCKKKLKFYQISFEHLIEKCQDQFNSKGEEGCYWAFDSSCLYQEEQNTECLLICCFKQTSSFLKKTKTKKMSHHDLIQFVQRIGDQILDRIVLRGSPQITQSQIIVSDLNQSQKGLIVTQGSHLPFVWSLPFVDSYLTYSNSAHETFKFMGIEASYTLLNFQIQSFLQKQKAQVHERHSSLIARTMTRQGKLMPFHRHAFNSQKDMSVFQKISFEEMIRVLMNAAMFQQSDPFLGVTERLMAGLLLPTGTGRYRFPPEDKQPSFKAHIFRENEKMIQNAKCGRPCSKDSLFVVSSGNGAGNWDPSLVEFELKEMEEKIKEIEIEQKDVGVKDLSEPEKEALHPKSKPKKRQLSIQEQIEDIQPSAKAKRLTKTQKLFLDQEMKQKVMEEYGNHSLIRNVLGTLSAHSLKR